MNRIELRDGAVQIDADLIARGLDLDPDAVQALMRGGEITSVCERGLDQDAGRYRLTFFHKSRRFRLVVNESGSVLQSSTVNFGDRPLPASMHRR